MNFLVLFLCCSAQLLLAESKVIPDYLPQLCSKTVSNYSECTYNVLKKMGPHLLKGVPELNFPKLTPLDIPLLVINRTLNNFLSMEAVMKNVQVWGYDEAQIEHFKFDSQNMNGELWLRFPHSRLYSEFESNGKFLNFVLDNTGYWDGNYTNSDFRFKFSLKQVDKLGVKFYSLEDLKVKTTVGNGVIKMISKNPESQATLDALVNFWNMNFQTVFNAIQTIYEKSLEVVYKSLVEQVLNIVPAVELIPE